MRKTATAILLLTFTLAAFSPTLGQRAFDQRSSKTSSRVLFDKIIALTDGSGVLVRWYMKSENGVAGYDLYRIASGGREKITPSPVLGSAAQYGERTAYGEFYQFFDLTGEAGSEYIVEGFLLSGQKFVSKSLTAVRVNSLEAEVGTSTETFINTRTSANSNVEQRASSLSGELQDLVSLHEQEPDPVNQVWVAAQPGAKITVRRDGFYRVSVAELSTANFAINSDSSKWRLFMNGVEQAIIVGPSGSYIEFYGKGVQTPETDSRIYYLIADAVAGKRITTRAVRQVPGGAESTRYSVSAVKKERTNLFKKIFNGDEENYLGGLVLSDTARINFSLTGVDFSAPTAKIDITLFGFTNNPHAVTPRINGNELPVFRQFGNVYFNGAYTIPTSHLVEGVNELQLTSSVPGDQSLFDNVKVDYQRKYVSDDNRISFSTPGYRKIDVSGFSTSNVRVFDLTFDGQPVLLANIPVESNGSTFTAKIPSSRVMVGYALENSALLQSPGIMENRPSTLSSDRNAADMLIISHGTQTFMTAAETWATYRRSSAGGGLDVKVIDVADVFDEFSYGTVSAESIKSFLKFTSTDWANGPEYVLLIGDSTDDPRNYEGFGSFNLVPTKSITLILEESVSDEALGDFDEDGLSELAIGRIPARTAAQITTAYNKTVAYEANQQSFSRGALFAHDVPLGFDFENMSQQLSQELPPGTPFNMVSAGEANAQATLISRMNEGKFIVNYSGHGAAGLWANSGFFNNNTPSLLTNASNPSVYSMLTCLNGYFVRSNAESLGEVLLFSPNGGAAASWASSSETTPDIQLIMALKFFDQMSSGNIEKMGDLIKDAKTSISAGADVRLSWVLVGDPALKLP